MIAGLEGAARRAVGGRKYALLAASEALKAADPRAMMRHSFQLRGEIANVGSMAIDLSDYRQVLVVGAGKASALMAAELEQILGSRIDRGIVVVPEYQRPLPILRRIGFAESTHPLPTRKGVQSTRKMLEVLRDADSESLVICLLSGGGSSLLTLPPEGVGVADLALTVRLLQDAGARIGELNCVRKHLSLISGGRLVGLTGGARMLSLIISDVVGDDLSSVASGPTVADPTTFADAVRVLQSRGLWRRIPASVRTELRTGIETKKGESLKPGDARFRQVSNVLIGSNMTSIVHVKAFLEDDGFRVSSFGGSVTGESRAVGKKLASLAKAQKGKSRWAAVWGGETTVTVKGKGVGGRNQEMALAAGIALDGSSGITVLCMGTDGIDGSSDAAGAIADSSTFDRARAMGLDPLKYLKDNDSYHFFEALGDLVVTGPTGTNVNDVMVALRTGD